MANAATSSDFVYDVFLSFRGDGGTRYGFTDHLYQALRCHKINAFRDDHQLNIGDEIRSYILRAIQVSRICMVVLCQNYASSTWCLEELAKIIECYENTGKHVSAIFYKVEPSDVRHQRNNYEAAMIKHENRFGQHSKEVKAWRKALRRVCDLTGVHCRHDMYESEVIEKIVRDTLAKLSPMPSRMKRLVGLDSGIELNCLMDIGSADVLKIENPRILITPDTTFSIESSHLPNSSQLFDWKGCPLQSFPSHFYPKRIVDFESPHSSLIFEDPFQKFEELTFINLSQCQSITQIPNMFGAIKLKTLILDRCHQLEAFDESIGFMPKLVYLSASECNNLKSFAPKMYLPSLEVLSFNFCKRFKCFPDVVLKMDKPLKISMINTAIKGFPKSIDNLVGLEYIDVSFCRRLSDLSASFLLPKLITLRIDGCSQLGGSFKRFIKSQSMTNGPPNLVALYLSEANISYADLYIILENFSKLEYLDVSYNNFASLPRCVTGSLYLRSLDVSYCRNLKEIPKLPISIQKVDARYCGSLSSTTSSMLWSKVYEEKERLQIVVPKRKISDTFVFDHVSNEGIPLFWARWKFPVIAIAFMFGEARENDDQIHTGFTILDESEKSHLVGLHLFIEDQEICRKDFHYYSVGEHHVLLCDLRTLFSDQEWQVINDYLGVDWKAIQVHCESCLTLNRWGVYMYKQKTNKNDIKFKPPNTYFIPPSGLVPKRTPQMSQQRIRHALENMNPSEIFGKYLPLSELDDTPSFTKTLLRSWRKAKVEIGGYGTGLKPAHEESIWDDMARVVELMKHNVPKHVADSFTDDMQSACIFLEQFFRLRMEFMKEIGHGRLNIINIPLFEIFHYDGTEIIVRSMETLRIKRGDPNFKQALRWINQQTWRFWVFERFSRMIIGFVFRVKPPSPMSSFSALVRMSKINDSLVELGENFAVRRSVRLTRKLRGFGPCKSLIRLSADFLPRSV